MGRFLMVPIHLDALWLKNEQAAVEAMADFAYLPYFDGDCDVNPDVAYVSEEIVSQPLQNRNLRQKEGIHLHWALPYALTKGTHSAEGTVFPRVPNRWLVTRSGGGTTEKQWVVESDYLYPEGDGRGCVCMPYQADADKGPHQPFRYTGRRMELDAWQEKDDEAEYLDRLTAIGYGQPAFAAFYPNCHSVFGFYDGEHFADIPDGLRYEVIGWYSDPEQDQLLETFLTDFEDEYQSNDGNRQPVDEESKALREALERELKWTVADVSTQAFPEKILCYARTTFRHAGLWTENPAKNDANITIAVGNTGTEALSAYLANEIDSSNRITIEEQLEALLLAPRLAGRQLDIGPKFQEARHMKGFTGVRSGTLWTIGPATVAASPAEARARTAVTLPDPMADHIYTVNLLQRAYDRANHEIESRRRQLFSDWYKYMLCAYPPEDTRDDYPDIDEVKYYVEVQSVAPLQKEIAETGRYNLALLTDRSGNIKAACLLLFSIEAEDQTQLDTNHIPDQLRRRFENEGPFPLSSNAALLVEETGRVWRVTDAGNTFVVQKENDILHIYWVSPAQYPDSLLRQLAQAINRLLEAIADHNIQSSLLTGGDDGDISDWPGFCSRFRAESGKARPDHIEGIWVLLDEGIQGTICENWEEESSLEDSDKRRIIDALNTILKDRDFDQDGAFNGVTISNEARELLSYDPKDRSQEQRVRLNRLLLEASFPEEIVKSPRPCTLKRIAAPRYWRPTEPVVLIIGEAAKATLRHGQGGGLGENGLPECHILQDEELQYPISKGDLPRIREEIDRIETSADEDHFAFKEWTHQPWHPFLLEWEVEVFPTARPDIWRYATDFITSNYDLADNEVDLSVRPGVDTVKAANLYSGSSILTPHAKIVLKERIVDYLSTELPDNKSKIENIPSDAPGGEDYQSRLKEWYEKKPSYTQDDLDIAALVKWYQDKPVDDITDGKVFSDLSDEDKAKDPIYTALRALNVLQSLNCLSQALGGFNEALLMRKQTMQLPIADPLGFDDYQPFADQVSGAVQRSIRSAPQPLNDFNPIRSGDLTILQLRLVDTFGQVRDVPVHDSQVMATEGMTIPDVARSATAGTFPQLWLAPRLVQPARLNFRWLAASQGAAGVKGQREMNDHPATSPICGWVLPNKLDNSLMVYDSRGKPLGAITIDPDEPWQPAPGSDEATPLDEISNPHLKRVVSFVLDRGQAFLQDFISVLDVSLENIDPEGFARHRELALLMGRPIAVVRTSLDLELQGLPVLHQGWNVFRLDMTRDTRDTAGFTRVKIPVRLGEYRQLNDGLVGYWIEANDGYEDDLFYAPQVDPNANDCKPNRYIRIHKEDDPSNIHLSVEDPPRLLTMLVDPRAKVHATCGILPAKAIDIPPDQYVTALQGIEVTFLSAPILTEQGEISLPLPAEPGYSWSWLENKGDSGWSETLSTPTVEERSFAEELADLIWCHLLDKSVRWLQATEPDGTKAKITPPEERARAQAGLGEQDEVIQGILDRQRSPDLTIEKEKFLASVQEDIAGPLWKHLLDPTVGWLQPPKGQSTKARVTPKDRRESRPLGPDFEGLESKVDTVLDLCQVSISPVSSEAAFAGPQEIREGWLKLSRYNSE